MNIKNGIILAAGLGNRLSSKYSTSNSLKPLIVVGEIELLLRTIRSQEIAGCNKIIIVTGWQAQILKSEIHSRYTGSSELIFAYNKQFHLKNGVSLLCSRPYIDEHNFLLTMADHVLDDDIMFGVKNHYPPPNGATLCVDYKLSTIFDMDDATKVFEKNGFIMNIGKSLNSFNCVDTGVFVGTGGLLDAVESVFRNKGDASLSDGVQVLAERGLMTILDIKDSFWQDVDTPEMLAHAEKMLNQKREK